MATLSDVAKEAGFSLATASQAIDGSTNRSMRADLRERARAVAAQLDLQVRCSDNDPVELPVVRRRE